jgi:beta-1,3-glucuronyltransferase
MRELLIVTPTYARPDRLAYINRCIDIFRLIHDLRWIVIEDGLAPCPDLLSLLVSSQIPFHYLATGPSRDKGNLQRALAMQFVFDNKLEGIVYNADDDNLYEESLFCELRKIQFIGIFPVGNLGPHGIEGPVVRNKRIVSWDCGWPERRYPVDMAGFAFHSSLLDCIPPPFWNHRGIGGESEFIERLISDSSEFETLCDDCTRCFVWHNHPLAVS